MQWKTASSIAVTHLAFARSQNTGVGILGFTKRDLGGLLLGGIVGSRFFAQGRERKLVADATRVPRSEQEEKPSPTRLYTGARTEIIKIK